MTIASTESPARVPGTLDELVGRPIHQSRRKDNTAEDGTYPWTDSPQFRAAEETNGAPDGAPQETHNMNENAERGPGTVAHIVGCRYCLGLQRWEGDAPLPFPLTIFDKGLTELHCGYDGAPSPRFRFECPICTANATGERSAKGNDHG